MFSPYMQQRGSPKRYLLESRNTAITHLRHLVSATHLFCNSDLFRFADQDALADLGDEIVAALLAVIGAAIALAMIGIAAYGFVNRRRMVGYLAVDQLPGS